MQGLHRLGREWYSLIAQAILLRNSSVHTVFLALFYSFGTLQARLMQLLDQIFIIIFISVISFRNNSLHISSKRVEFPLQCVSSSTNSKLMNWQFWFRHIIPVKSLYYSLFNYLLKSTCVSFPKRFMSVTSHFLTAAMYIGCQIGIS